VTGALRRKMAFHNVAWSLAVAGTVIGGQPAAGQSLTQPSAVPKAAPAPAAPRPYDGIQAGLDAYRLAEQQRQANLSQQLYRNDQLRVWNGLRPSGARTMYYGYGAPGYAAYAPASASAPASTVAPATGAGPLNAIPPQANLDYAYGYGYARPFGAVATPWGGLSVFEPWPYVPGNIYGYPYVPQPAKQPIGRYEAETSPAHWESQPVYAPPLAPRPPPLASPAVSAPPSAAILAPAAKTATEPVPPPPPARPPTGPREY